MKLTSARMWPLQLTGRAVRAHGRPILLMALAGMVSVGAAYAADVPDPTAKIESGAGPVVASLDDGTRKQITGFVIEFVRENAGHPFPEEVLEAVVELTETPDGWVQPREGEPVKQIRLADVGALSNQWFFDSALPEISQAVVRRLQELGLIGVYVEPDPEQIRVEDEVVVDKRPEGVTTLTLQVTTGVVTSLRTVGLGERLPEDQTVDNKVHQRIKDRSPVYPNDGQRVQSDLLRRDLIDDYVFRLNRHPGRRADVAVAAAGDEPGGVALDYVVTENRPWMLFAQVSNTGTRANESDIRQRFGFIHNQLTNNDDIFTVDFMTGSFKDIYSVNASYGRPFFDSERLRWKVFGSWYEYDASTVGLLGAEFSGEGYTVGAEMVGNFYQDRDLFIDAVGGVRWEHVETDNDFINDNGNEDFFIPYVGLRLERVRQSEQTFAGLTAEFNVPGIAGTNDGVELDRLGRTDSDNDWITLFYDASHSFYLEPVFSKKYEDEMTLAHELALSVRGQWSLGSRLVPNQQGVIGGLYTVRGYPESIAAGDSIIVGTLEYRYHVPKGMMVSEKPGQLAGTPFRWQPQYQFGYVDWDLILKAFIDVGRTHVNDRFSFESNETLVGAGVGLELALTRRLNGRVDFGFPLRDFDDPGGNDNDVDVGDWAIHWVVTVIF